MIVLCFRGVSDVSHMFLNICLRSGSEKIAQVASNVPSSTLIQAKIPGWCIPRLELVS